jgi:hypothetical protein
LVSFITGFKNSMKGVGYFIGAASLMVSYYFALGVLVLLILAAMPWAILGLSNQLGRCSCQILLVAPLFPCMSQFSNHHAKAHCSCIVMQSVFTLVPGGEDCLVSCPSWAVVELQTWFTTKLRHTIIMMMMFSTVLLVLVLQGP